MVLNACYHTVVVRQDFTAEWVCRAYTFKHGIVPAGRNVIKACVSFADNRFPNQNLSGISVCDTVGVAFILRLPACRNTSTIAVLQDTTDKQANIIAGNRSVRADVVEEVLVLFGESTKFRKQYIKTVNDSRERNGEPLLTEDEEITIEDNINALLDLKVYSLPALRISAQADEEAVSEIFVRVNSGGQKLTEKNFIETLLAVFDNDVHDQIDKFCEASRIPVDGTAYNHILKVDPAHLIRVAVGYGFHRARLRYAYQLMRGKDLKTGIVTTATRDENLSKFKEALDIVTNLNNWHAYLNLFAQAGYINGDFVAATNAVVYCYVMYLIGKFEYKVKTADLNKIITKWIYMTTVTFLYSGSTESTVEGMFADLRDVKTPDDYVKYLEDFIAGRFTDDYFNVTLPKDLATSSTSSPAWLGYIAAINVLGTPMLFSTAILSKFLVPGASGTKNAIDRHHIFPKHYLEENGYFDDRDRNQVANYTYIDYATNIVISDRPPIEYVSEFRAKLGEEEYRRTCRENALPENFESLDYPTFLTERRKLMAGIIRQGYERLCL